MQKFGNYFLVKQLIEDLSEGKTKLKILLQLLAFSCIVLALARPQMGSKLEEVKREGSDLVLAVDVSNSMLAEDLAPNRLNKAKQYLLKLIDELQGDRIGIVVFAGEAFVQLPITNDYAAAKLFINTISTDIVPTQGTAIGAALKLAVRSFGDQQENAKKLKNKAIIVITDGENHEDNALEEVKIAQEQGISVHTIGMGSAQGAPIPQFSGETRIGYKKDKQENTVISKLNEVMLQELAAAGKGLYIRASNTSNSLETLMKEIQNMDKEHYESKSFTDYDEKFQYFVAMALFFLSLDFFISRRKSKWLEKINLFGTTQ